MRRREGVFITLVADHSARREGRPELRGERGAFLNFRAPAVDEASLGRRLHDFHADVARCIAEVDGPQFDVAALLGDPGVATIGLRTCTVTFVANDVASCASMSRNRKESTRKTPVSGSIVSVVTGPS